MARTKEEDYQDRNKRLKELGLKPVHNSLKEEKKAMAKLHKESEVLK